MLTLTPDNIAWSLTLLLVAARVGGVFLAGPVFSHAVFPVRLRVAMTLVVAVAVVGRIAQPPALPPTVAHLAVALALEAAIGAVIGFAARLLLVGVELGAWHAAQQMGIGLAEVYNPHADELSGPVTTLFRMLAVMAFLAVGGHRDVLGALLRSFRTVPLRSGIGMESAVSLVVGLLGASFSVALKVAAPVLVALLLAGAVLGALQKSVPQLHVLSTNLPIRTLLGLLVLAASVASVAWVVEAEWTRTFDRIADYVTAGAPR